MKNDRLFGILLLLLDKGFATAESLATRFEVSPRTIYRDMDALNASGIPIVSDSGPGGGYSILRSFRFDRSYFSPKELAALDTFTGGISDIVNDPELESALGKIRAMGKTGRSGFRPSLRFAAPPWSVRMPGEKLVEPLRSACEESIVVSFSYIDAAGARSERSAEPREVIITQFSYYLHAFCRTRADFRLFKLSRMESLRLGPERFDPNLRQFPEPWASMWGSEQIERIVIEIDETALPRVLDIFPDARRQPAGKNRISLAFEHPSGQYLAGILLSIPGTRVIEPPGLKDLCLEICSAFAAANNH